MVSHLRYWICVAFAIFHYASGSPRESAAEVSRTVESLNPPTPGSVYKEKFEVDDVFVLSQRDLSPDVLASSVPISTKIKVDKFHRKDDNLRLRSSTYNVSDIKGYRIYALPIFANEWSSLLLDTRTHLQTFDSDATTKFFQFNNTKWSFTVAAPNTTLHYASIQATVARFINLSTPKSQSDITTTRVGLLFNGSEPIADVIITPCPATTIKSGYVPFANFSNDHNLSSSEPIEINQVTAYGSTCSYATINETNALAPFLYPLSTQSLNPRALDTDILHQVGATVFAITLHIIINAVNGRPVRVEPWMLISVLSIAPMYMLLAVLDGLCNGALEAMDLREKLLGTGALTSAQVDSGFFQLGHMLGRLVMRITKPDAQGRLIALKWETWRKIIGRLMVPGYRGDVDGRGEQAWAMEGEIYGPENGDEGENASDGAAGGSDDGSEGGDGGGGGGAGHTNQMVIGQWQLWIGDTNST